MSTFTLPFFPRTRHSRGSAALIGGEEVNRVWMAPQGCTGHSGTNVTPGTPGPSAHSWW